MNLKLHHLGLALILASLPMHTLQAASAPASTEKVRVLAALPITHGLAEQLLAGSQVELQRAAPANIPGPRQISYFGGRGAASLDKLARQADAVIALRSIWAEDPLYPMARRSNIRVVEIDAARPVDGALPGIATQQAGSDDELSGQPWLSISNMGRMADVIAADLVRLAPADAQRIESNLATLKQRLLKLNAGSEQALAKVDNVTVGSLSERLDYLLTGLNLDLLPLEIPEARQWPSDALQALSTTLEENDVALVLHHTQPPKEVVDAIKAGGSQLLVIDEQNQDPVAALERDVQLIVKALQ
ncbi:zinc ABC transporter substrate-binding protein [Pseudomonas sp. ABC1]|uniref:metal ABC transporter substrate-binding protein n=1 Tax=Pseudomonas sp. ABC1 TaxID=2748080 RepID=UPI0015C32CDB|nr:zinc ABC transporter substrate-binding protein [Pseudomonas sp. ABC1]QLF94520.1 zinc ABC transporter substrate-binding protein [Pseudomonas sp. ABC1]